MVMYASVNYVAILAAAIASMIIGYLWYSPYLFGKIWAKESGYDAKKKGKKQDMTKAYALNYVTAVVTAFVLSQFLAISYSFTLGSAVQTAFWAWLGFIAPMQFSIVLYEQQSLKIFTFKTAYELLSLAVMAAILVSI
ncbi:MAG TPA: DUF1761 domain-containing protein [Candidatus Norongarragalinales archaeon]|nr:DUF1761 domain-containing protein [Candidatus Norongarragalinales archaeon]